MTTAEIIKHYRNHTPYRVFAAQLGVSHAAIQQWETGQTEPSNERINAFTNDKRGWVREMGKALFLARNGQTLKTLVKGN